MFRKIGHFILLMLLPTACAAPAAVAPAAGITPTVPVGTPFTQSDLVAVAEKFSTLLIDQQDYTGIVNLDSEGILGAPASYWIDLKKLSPGRIGA